MMTKTKWENFTREELACPCCGEMHMDEGFMNVIQHIRTRMGVPLNVTSAYRCSDYNSKISSTGRDGPHTTGLAIDIQIAGADVVRLMQEALPYMTGIGLKQHGEFSGRFIHLDMIEGSDTIPRPRVWTYV